MIPRSKELCSNADIDEVGTDPVWVNMYDNVIVACQNAAMALAKCTTKKEVMIILGSFMLVGYATGFRDGRTRQKIENILDRSVMTGVN